VQARIESIDRAGQGTANLLLWHQIEFTKSLYEEGFDTVNTRPLFTLGGVVHPYHRMKYQLSNLPRASIYKKVWLEQPCTVAKDTDGETHVPYGRPESERSSFSADKRLILPRWTSMPKGTSLKPTSTSATTELNAATGPGKKKSMRLTSVGLGGTLPLEARRGVRSLSPTNVDLAPPDASDVKPRYGLCAVNNRGQYDRQNSGAGCTLVVDAANATKDRLEPFLRLFQNAEASLPLASAIGADILKEVQQQTPAATSIAGTPNHFVSLKIAGLKGISRGWTKVLTGYHGNASKLTDVVRMTYTCGSLATVLRVFDAIAAHPALAVKRVKNRLMLEYDAVETGGYRDLLINVSINDTGHIFEIQVTLEGLMAIKTGGGHLLYKLARTLNLLDAEVTWCVAH
jgi:hypothetical protein